MEFAPPTVDNNKNHIFTKMSSQTVKIADNNQIIVFRDVIKTDSSK